MINRNVLYSLKLIMMPIVFSSLLISIFFISQFAWGTEDTVCASTDENLNVCELNGVQYTSVQDAYWNANNGDTIKMIADYNITSPIKIGQDDRDINLTIDLNSKSISGIYDLPGKDNRLLILYKGSLTITDNSSEKNGLLTGGKCTTNGGAIYVFANTKLDISNITISNNTGSAGGAIHSELNTSINITNSNLIENIAESGGGAIFANGTTSIDTCIIKDNNATMNGGGIYIQGDSNKKYTTEDLKTCTIKNSMISSNYSATVGGGIYADFCDVELKMQDTEVSTNIAKEFGGGIALLRPASFLGSCLVYENKLTTKELNNVYIRLKKIEASQYPQKIKIINPTSDMYMGISLEDYELNSEFVDCENDLSQYLFCDNEKYIMKYNSGNKTMQIIINNNVCKIIKTFKKIKYYETVQSAYDDSTAGDTITMIKDHEIITPIKLKQNKNITINLASKQIIGKYTASGPDNRLFILYKGSLTITDDSSEKKGLLTGGKCSTNGGAIYVFANTKLEISNITISNNTGSAGGAIHSELKTSINITNSNLIENIAKSGGGAIFANGTTSIDTCIIKDNNATMNGGGIYIQGDSNKKYTTEDLKTCTIKNSMISSNYSATAGGGIYADFCDVELKMQDTEVSTNTAKEFGGGIALLRPASFLGSCLVYENKLTSKELSNVYIRLKKIEASRYPQKIQIINPTSDMYMGISLEDYELNSKFVDCENDLSKYLFCDNKYYKMQYNPNEKNMQIILKDYVCKIETLLAKTKYYETVQSAYDDSIAGDTITMINDHEVITPIKLNQNKNITINLASKQIIGKYSASGPDNRLFILYKGSLTITDDSSEKKGLLTGGKCTTNGGAIYTFANTNLNISNITISNNTGLCGGAIHSEEGANIIISNSNLIENIAKNGGGAIFANGTTLIDTCNIKDNNATMHGGGVYIQGDPNKKYTTEDLKTCTIKNSIISSNYSATYGGGIYADLFDVELNMQNTLVTNNIAVNYGGGIALKRPGAFSGLCIVANNKLANGGANNIYITLKELEVNEKIPQKIKILNTAPGMKMGISLEDYEVNSNFVDCDKDLSQYLFCDNNNYVMQYNSVFKTMQIIPNQNWPEPQPVVNNQINVQTGDTTAAVCGILLIFALMTLIGMFYYNRKLKVL